jgi:type 1 glutamine amidotransferase
VRPRIPHEILIVIGGWSNGDPTNSIEVYNDQINIWQTFVDMNDKSNSSSSLKKNSANFF